MLSLSRQTEGQTDGRTDRRKTVKQYAPYLSMPGHKNPWKYCFSCYRDIKLNFKKKEFYRKISGE